MIKLKKLLLEQIPAGEQDFSKELFEELKTAGFGVNDNNPPAAIIYKSGFSLTFENGILTEGKFPFKTDIKDMGSDRIAKEFATEWVARDTYGKMLSYTATADDIAFNKTLKPKDRAMNVVDPVSRSDFGYWEYTSMGSNLIISAIGKTKETTTLYKYLPDIKKLGEIAVKWTTFNNANFKDQVKIMGQDLKQMAQPGIDKAKQAVKGVAQNLFNKDKQKTTTTQ
jgi:hypothetical protein